jgi:hypothetical protein
MESVQSSGRGARRAVGSQRPAAAWSST